MSGIAIEIGAVYTKELYMTLDIDEVIDIKVLYSFERGQGNDTDLTEIYKVMWRKKFDIFSELSKEEIEDIESEIFNIETNK